MACAVIQAGSVEDLPRPLLSDCPANPNPVLPRGALLLLPLLLLLLLSLLLLLLLLCWLSVIQAGSVDALPLSLLPAISSRGGIEREGALIRPNWSRTKAGGFSGTCLSSLSSHRLLRIGRVPVLSTSYARNFTSGSSSSGSFLKKSLALAFLLDIQGTGVKRSLPCRREWEKGSSILLQCRGVFPTCSCRSRSVYKVLPLATLFKFEYLVVLVAPPSLRQWILS